MGQFRSLVLMARR